MSIIEVRLFQQASVKIPVTPVTTTPCSKYIYKEYEPEMTSEDVPWYLKDDIQGLSKEIQDATQSSDRTSVFACKACGVVPSVRERRYVVKEGKMYLACSAQCVEEIKKRKE